MGTIDFYFAKKVKSIVSCDLSDRAISIAKKNAYKFNLDNITFRTINLDSNTLRGKYDLVFCLEVLEHIKDPQKFIFSVKNNLNDGGSIILTTPLISAPLNRLHLLTKFDKKVGHLWRFNESDLVELLNKSGLKVEKIEYKEGILRNILFTSDIFGLIVKLANKFIFISDLISYVDGVLLKLFGASNIYLQAKR